jgi:hypothetical protein
MYKVFHLLDFLNLIGKFIANIVKMPKLILYFSHDGVSLKKVKRLFS